MKHLLNFSYGSLRITSSLFRSEILGCILIFGSNYFLIFIFSPLINFVSHDYLYLLDNLWLETGKLNFLNELET